MTAMPQRTFRRESDPTSVDICRALRELAIEAGYVHREGRRSKTPNVAKLAELWGQNNQTVSTWLRQYPPRTIDLPWIERKLGYEPGAVLIRAGFVRIDIVSLIKSDERITPDFKESLVLYAQAALGELSAEGEETLRRTSLAS